MKSKVFKVLSLCICMLIVNITFVNAINKDDEFDLGQKNLSENISISGELEDLNDVITTNIINKQKSKIYDIENTLYAVLVLNEGSISDYKFFIDGDEVEFKRVNKSGTILKLEVSDFENKDLKIIGNDKEESFILSM